MTEDAATRTQQHPALAEPHTKEERRGYVSSAPPPKPQLPPIAEYRTLSPAARQDLDQRRIDYHSALIIVQTPAMQQLHQQLRMTTRMNQHAPAGARRGHVIDGSPTLGKSTIVKTFGRDHELVLREHYPERFEQPCRDYTPVVYISVPAGATRRCCRRA